VLRAAHALAAWPIAAVDLDHTYQRRSEFWRLASAFSLWLQLRELRAISHIGEYKIAFVIDHREEFWCLKRRLRGDVAGDAKAVGDLCRRGYRQHVPWTVYITPGTMVQEYCAPDETQYRIQYETIRALGRQLGVGDVHQVSNVGWRHAVPVFFDLTYYRQPEEA
jgi:hypothetical protein